MKQYHHMGIPTTKPRKGEVYIDKLKMHVFGYENSPYGVEWLRFDADCPLPELVKNMAHVAFVVDDLMAEIEGKEILIEVNSPSEGVLVAFINDNGAPIEFMQFTTTEAELKYAPKADLR